MFRIPNHLDCEDGRDVWLDCRDRKMTKKEKIQQEKKQLARDKKELAEAKRKVKQLDKEIKEIIEVKDMLDVEDYSESIHDFANGLAFRTESLYNFNKSIKILERKLENNKYKECSKKVNK